MRKAIAIMIQIIILTAAWYFISVQITDNTYFGFVSYDVDVISENIRWTMLTAGILSVFNIWVWWPKSPAQQTVEKPAESTKSAETEDPMVPKMD